MYDKFYSRIWIDGEEFTHKDMTIKDNIISIYLPLSDELCTLEKILSKSYIHSLTRKIGTDLDYLEKKFFDVSLISIEEVLHKDSLPTLAKSFPIIVSFSYEVEEKYTSHHKGVRHE